MTAKPTSMLKDKDYWLAKDPSVPYGVRVRILMGPHKDFVFWFNDIWMEEDGKLKFLFTPSPHDMESNASKGIWHNPNDPDLHVAILHILQDLNNRSSDALYANGQ